MRIGSGVLAQGLTSLCRSNGRRFGPRPRHNARAIFTAKGSDRGRRCSLRDEDGNRARTSRCVCRVKRSDVRAAPFSQTLADGTAAKAGESPKIATTRLKRGERLRNRKSMSARRLLPRTGNLEDGSQLYLEHARHRAAHLCKSCGRTPKTPKNGNSADLGTLSAPGDEAKTATEGAGVMLSRQEQRTRNSCKRPKRAPLSVFNRPPDPKQEVTHAENNPTRHFRSTKDNLLAHSISDDRTPSRYVRLVSSSPEPPEFAEKQ